MRAYPGAHFAGIIKGGRRAGGAFGLANKQQQLRGTYRAGAAIKPNPKSQGRNAGKNQYSR